MVSIIRDLLAGRIGVDAVALLSMVGALALWQNLAAIVVAVMYAGGNALEELAISRAERDLRSLIDHAPRVTHRETAGRVDDLLAVSSRSVTGCSIAQARSFLSTGS
jgi:cation transport ATPase